MPKSDDEVFVPFTPGEIPDKAPYHGEAPSFEEPAPTVPEGELLTLTGRPFFKNAVVYRLPDEYKLSPVELEAHLAKRPLTPCGPLDQERGGWVNPSPLKRPVHTVGNQSLIALGNHKKILPASMVKQEVEKRAVALEAEQGAPVGKKQKRRLKEEVRAELLAKAMVRTTTTRAWIDADRRWLVVEAAGVSRAEKLVSALRDLLETFAVTLLNPDQAPAFTMAGWLRTGEPGNNMVLDTDLELQSADMATVRYARHALDGEDIKKHLDAGKVVTKMGLTWNDKVTFVLTSKLELKKITFLELLTEKAEPGEEEEEDTGPKISNDDQFDADLLLMSDELGQLLGDLSLALGLEYGYESSEVGDA